MYMCIVSNRYRIGRDHIVLALALIILKKRRKSVGRIACTGKKAASVLLKLFIMGYERSHTNDAVFCYGTFS